MGLFKNLQSASFLSKRYIAVEYNIGAVLFSDVRVPSQRISTQDIPNVSNPTMIRTFSWNFVK